MARDLLKVSAEPVRRKRPEANVALDAAAWFALLSPEGQELFTRNAAVRVAQPGEVLFREGEDLHYWFGVLKGFVSLETEHASLSLRSGAPGGSWFGEHLLVSETHADCSALVLAHSKIAALPKVVFDELVLNEPRFTQHICLISAQRLEVTRRRLLMRTRLSLDASVACAIADLFEPRAAFSGSFHLALKQAALANFLGLSRQRVNSTLNLLSRHGELVLGYGHIEVVNPTRLRQRALSGEFA